MTVREKFAACLGALRRGRLHDVTIRKLPQEKQRSGVELRRLDRRVASDTSPLAGGWQITRIVDNTPADRVARAGALKVGDIVVKVDGVSMMTSKQSSSNIRFRPEATSITLTVFTLSGDDRNVDDEAIAQLEAEDAAAVRERRFAYSKANRDKGSGAILNRDAQFIGLRFTETETGDDVWEITDVFFDATAYERVLVQYWNTTHLENKRPDLDDRDAFEYTPLTELQNFAGLAWIDPETHRKSEYELLREARIAANQNWLREHGFAVP